MQTGVNTGTTSTAETQIEALNTEIARLEQQSNLRHYAEQLLLLSVSACQRIQALLALSSLRIGRKEDPFNKILNDLDSRKINKDLNGKELEAPVFDPIFEEVYDDIFIKPNQQPQAETINQQDEDLYNKQVAQAFDDFFGKPEGDFDPHNPYKRLDITKTGVQELEIDSAFHSSSDITPLQAEQQIEGMPPQGSQQQGNS